MPLPQIAAPAAQMPSWMALPEAVPVRIQAGVDQQAPRLDGGGRTVHFYSRHKAEIRAENLRTLGLIRERVGNRFGQTSLQNFEARLNASVRKGDRPLTIGQLKQVMATAARDAAADAEASPLGRRAFERGISDMFAAATRLLQRLPDDNPDKRRFLTSLDDALQDARTKIGHTAIAPDLEAAGEIKESAQRAIAGTLRQLEGMTLEGGARPLTKSDVQRLVREANVQELNRAGRWEPIAKTVTLPAVGAGQIPVPVTSTITPAGHTGAHFAHDYHDAGGQVTGVCSTDTGNREHAANLARTTLTDAENHTVFRAVRHGVCSAYGISNPAERLEANRTRAVELLTLVAQDAVSANPGLLEAAQNAPRNVAGSHAQTLGGSLTEPLLSQATEQPVLELPLVSLSLLTPDAFRRGAGNEAQFLREQNAALQSLKENPPTITLNDPHGNPVEIRVRPQLATFNFPVNAAPQGNALARGIAGGYFTSYGQNKAAFNALLGENFMRTGNLAALDGIAGARIGSLLPEQQGEVRALAQQCRDLWQSDGHKDRGETPYRLPARLAVLTSLLGFPPAFNCKSGKDRTGQMDVEAKAVAAFIAQHHRPPYLNGADAVANGANAATADADAAALQRIRIPMALEGGNHEMQIKNTGFAGFKTLGVSGLDRALGDEMPRVVGFSRLVKD